MRSRNIQSCYPINDNLRIAEQPGPDAFGEISKAIAQNAASATRPINRPIR